MRKPPSLENLLSTRGKRGALPKLKSDIYKKSMLHVVLRECRALDDKVPGSYILLPNTMYTILELAVLGAGPLGHPDCSRATSQKMWSSAFH
jgi:hypothetical protein